VSETGKFTVAQLSAPLQARLAKHGITQLFEIQSVRALPFALSLFRSFALSRFSLGWKSLLLRVRALRLARLSLGLPRRHLWRVFADS